MLASIKVCDEISDKPDVTYTLCTWVSGQTLGFKHRVGEVLVCNEQLIGPWIGWSARSTYTSFCRAPIRTISPKRICSSCIYIYICPLWPLPDTYANQPIEILHRTGPE